MEILIVLLFVSVMFLGAAALFLLRGIHVGDYEHDERLSLLPLETDDDRGAPARPAATSSEREGKGSE